MEKYVGKYLSLKSQSKKQMKTLNEIGKEAGTDKSSLLHGYLDQYQEILPSPSSVKKIVEIGLQRRDGEWKDSEVPSVKTWLEYFPKATVFGFDMQDIKFEHDRFKFFKGQQGRMYHHLQFANMIGSGKICLVVDDSSHRAPDQLLSFLFFWDKLKKGGIYIIEDVNAKVQQEYPEEYRTENVFKPYLSGIDHQWLKSESAGDKSVLVLKKK